MSAYMVGRPHIQYLIQAADSRRLHTMQGERFSFWDGKRRVSMVKDYLHSEECARAEITPTEAGQMLWDANRTSIKARYPDTREDFSNAPGPVGEDFAFRYAHSPYLSIDPAQVIRACDCLNYQSCEYDGWGESDAKAFVDALRSKAVRKMVDEDEKRRGVTLDWEIRETANA